MENENLLPFLGKGITCQKNELFDIPEIIETSLIKFEYRFDYKWSKYCRCCIYR